MSSASRVRGGLLAKNAALNVLGQVIPGLVAVVAIPQIVHSLGVERFGVLSLAWVALWYFGLVDLGLGRATTKFVAAALSRNETQQIPPIAWTSLTTQCLLGILGALLTIVVTPFLVGNVFNISGDLVDESILMFYILAIALPLVVCTGTLRGILEGSQRFDLVNCVKIPTNSMVFLLPAVATALGLGLPGVGLSLLVTIILTAAPYYLLCLRLFPAIGTAVKPSRELVIPLIRFGGWVTLSTMLVPVLIYSDRLIISTVISVAALAYYTAAYEVAARLLVIPLSVGSALFPAFSAVAQERDGVERLYARSTKHLLLMMGPITIVAVLFAGEFLRIWLGEDFAANSTAVFQWLAIGMLLNGLSQMPATLLDGVGRPDLRAKIFLAYLGPYLVVTWLLISQTGIVGAALAWALRAALELTCCTVVAWHVLGFRRTAFHRSGVGRGLVAFGCFGIIATFGTVIAARSLWFQGAIVAVCLAVFAAAIWWWVLDQTDKGGLKSVLVRLTLHS
jgi:O-antigen/teichoic acid export membrane protein